MSSPHPSSASGNGSNPPLASRPGRRQGAAMPVIRPARREDYAAVIALLDAAHLPHDDLTPEHLDDFLDYCDDHKLSYRFDDNVRR